jgi:putative protease
MKKKELLSPAGDKASLYQAIHNGCDAVYLGGKKFGARTYATNFSIEELISAIKYCHLYGVKIYVTINTIIYEEEINECLDYIRILHQNNVDAIILEDLGLISLVRHKFPNLEIHASTQMHNHNIEQIKLLEELGVKRVVVARELSIDEINNFKTNLELEAFIHGALCVCYSGECLFSSLLLNRSGNRGSCAQICRLPFKLQKNKEIIKTSGDYLLSPKELNTLGEVEKIISSNIYSLKIEGRMKSPFYVGYVTRLYRKLIDSYENNKKIEISDTELKNLAVLFNRDFTKGFLFNEDNQNIMNIQKSNHQGIHLGTILEINKDKIKIKLDEELNQEDGIRFKTDDKGFIVNFLYNEKGLLINHANKNDCVYVDNKINLKNKGEVLKTIDYLLEKELENYQEKKIALNCIVKAYINENLAISFSDGENEVIIEGSRVEEAKNIPTSKEIIIEKISSLGNTPFVMKNIIVNCDDNIFISMSEIKNIRRMLIDEITKKRENIVPHPFLEVDLKPLECTKSNFSSNININVLVRNEEQLITCLKENVQNIYVPNEELYNKYKEKGNIYLQLPRVIKKFKEYNNEKLLIEETGSFHKYASNNEVVTDYYFNVVNSYNYNFLKNKNVKRVTLSIENKLNSIKNIVDNIIDKEKIEVFIYGRPEVMITKYCPLNMLVNKDKYCHVCLNNDKYYLKDSNDRLYPIISKMDEEHLTHIFYYQNIDLINDLSEYQNIGIVNYRVEFFDETESQIKTIMRKIRDVKNIVKSKSNYLYFDF